MTRKDQEAKFKTTMELAKAITYLEEIVSSLRAGTLAINNGARGLVLKPEPMVKVELEAEQRSERELISVTLSWRKIVADQEPHLRISATAPVSSEDGDLAH